jgi:hypothetical protein
MGLDQDLFRSYLQVLVNKSELALVDLDLFRSWVLNNDGLRAALTNSAHKLKLLNVLRFLNSDSKLVEDVLARLLLAEADRELVGAGSQRQEVQLVLLVRLASDVESACASDKERWVSSTLNLP